ncbi:c-type cytochrome [Tuwongella immobilis]|uniref:Cytochrome c n=1 Tax=Tuwongella immobilis TaxID=692036 RepID=A0A6C2YPC9_9BACT|nr:c-type cytochrome [Tuwongella immobilis]VIP03306.1 probable cytochrome oxidase (cbb3-type) : Probable cytochrome oxidase (Cbb3-type) OS=Blastopirellula marina DSM 3645 GN=DSM3645_18176 PE=4 SV=1: PA14: Cytochrom_C: Cytochrom_C [Tuwongella immobilis]VTS03983.1 probable cytochrome oxidase (cbb3-type) : Probable cytochrome oxidase (Cbb3-type) OS=Blastopirellula marina DSM 3645 GN=DSM3645_18176 PE=4 SV=1: PA14: Cytochrom_C: Cytochrom_C [Tuwongella immobilis]
MRWFAWVLALISLSQFAGTIHAELPADIDSEDLRPGLLTTYSDGQSKSPIVRLEPTIALNWAANESAHPSLSAKSATVKWEGYINLFRAGEYRFEAELRGKAKVTIAGKSVFDATVTDAQSKLIRGPSVTLPAGTVRIIAEFERVSGAAQFALSWAGPLFRVEPLPHDFVGHISEQILPAFHQHQSAEAGRLLVEEHSCLRCHKAGDAEKAMAATLVDRQGPNLSQVGKRVYAGWIEKWLANPKALRPNTVMPKLFRDDEIGAAERYAVSRYLAGNQPLKPEPGRKVQDIIRSSIRGQRTFVITGCAACHANGVKPEENATEAVYAAGVATGAKAQYALGDVGSKTRPDKLAEYLQNPLAHHPAGRMPNMQLNGQDAQDLAHFLCKDRDESIENELSETPRLDPKSIWDSHAKGVDGNLAKRFESANPNEKWNLLGARLLVTKGCTSCHAAELDGKALPAIDSVAALSSVRQNNSDGCLSEKPTNKSPNYSFSPAERASIQKFLADGFTGAGSPASAYSARISFKRFNCLNCHQRDGEGGLSTELQNQMRQQETAENADHVAPPTLTGVGHKARTSWLRDVLVNGKRARPWMNLRMPQYGAANVGHLPEAIAVHEGIAPDDSMVQPKLDTAKIEAGRQLIGKTGFGCISCHDIAGIANSGTRGPELTTTNQRVRYDWYRRWLEQAQRMVPGTRMPQVFVNGKSLLPTVYDGNPDPQAEAMWAYLSLGANLPLPEGLEPPKGLVLAPVKKPELLRTFLNGAGNKAIAVGYPNGMSLAFDCQQCRLAFGWSGNFLDASPVWNNRGGAPAKLLGPQFWTAPPGHSWLVSGSRQAPDFSPLAKDPAYGADLPDGQMYRGPMSVKFLGYALDGDGVPTFRYRTLGASGSVATISERATPIRRGAAAGVLREFTVDGPTGESAWLLGGTSNDPPSLASLAGDPQPIDLKPGSAELAADSQMIVLKSGNGLQALLASGTPNGSKWHLQPKVGGGWSAILQIPPAEKSRSFRLLLWAIGKDEPELLKGLNP